MMGREPYVQLVLDVLIVGRHIADLLLVRVLEGCVVVVVVWLLCLCGGGVVVVWLWWWCGCCAVVVVVWFWCFGGLVVVVLLC